MPNVFRFDNFIVNIAPEDIVVVAPSEDILVVTLPEDPDLSQTKGGWFTNGNRNIADTTEVTLYQANVDTMYDDYVFEFESAEIRNNFINSIYDYINGASVNSLSVVVPSDSSKSASAATTAKTKPAAKKPSK